MLFSFGLIFLFGILLGAIFEKMMLPKILGILLAGILIGPYCLDLVSQDVLKISQHLRQIALIIILTRAGLALDIKDLINIGKPALFMCFVPALFEILGFVIIAPLLLDISVIDAAIMGSVVSAVSPAIIVPRMLKLIQEKKGTKKSIPQLIMAGASVDDIFVIVLFTSFVSISKGEGFSFISLLSIPLSIIFGILFGILFGMLIEKIFIRFNISSIIEVIVLLSISFILSDLEEIIKLYIPFSSLICIMSINSTIYFKNKELAKQIAKIFNNLWTVGEIVLFVLVGTAVNIKYAFSSAFIFSLLILFALIFRAFGVFLSIYNTNFNIKEKIFCVISYMPKATVQAAICSVPLSMGLECGDNVLTAGVLAILITAPLGAILIDNNYNKLL